MPIQHAIWKVGQKPEQLAESVLAKEQLLEDMIVAAPGVLSDEWMLIGRQENTRHGGRIDLLAIAPDASLVLIELKRDRTPREVVAQALDYASWVQCLEPGEIAAIYSRFAPGKSLRDEFRKRFGQELDEAALNDDHQIIIVATALDDSTERIVNYLSEWDLQINVAYFRVFTHRSEQLLSRAWLLDPMRVARSESEPRRKNEPWNGECYCSFGHDHERSWDDAVEYGFISAGGGTWYTKTLQLLSPGDRVWVKVPGRGFVGVCRVTGGVEPASSFLVKTPHGPKSILDVASHASYLREKVDDPELCEYFVPVRWLQTVPLDSAVQEIGMFGNQNTVCKPTTATWRTTVDRLKDVFPRYAE